MAPHVIFTASSVDSFPLSLMRVMIGALAFGLICVLLSRLKWKYSQSPWYAYFVIMCSLIVMVYVFGRWLVFHVVRSRELGSGKYQVVEGVVEKFHTMPSDGSSNESFVISGHVFSYSDFDKADITGCFNQTSQSHGPIHEGLVLRVKFTSDCILEIDSLSDVQK